MKTNIMNKTKLIQLLKAFAAEESGQSTTEYVLLLLFVVVAVKSAGGQLKTRIQAVLDAAFGKTQEAITEAETR